MRPLTATLIVGAALGLALGAWAQPPRYEVRTYTNDAQAPFNPAAPAATSENTLKEPWLCPYCGYSTGGSWDTSGAGGPAWDANTNDIPDEAESGGAPGDCPDPWNVHGATTAALVQAPAPERFMAYRWLASVLTLIRGIPFKPGDVDPAVIGAAPTNRLSRVRAAFAFDPGNAGLPGFDLGGQPTQVRFLLIPPGVARPTARYHSLMWEPGGAGTPGAAIPGGGANDLWGGDPGPWIQNGQIRISLNPWRAVDGDEYDVRCRVRNGGGNPLDLQIWSDSNGLEFDGNFDPSVGVLGATTASGAVRLSIAPGLMDYPGGGPPPPTYWWAFRFTIANNCRTMPEGTDWTGPVTAVDWIGAPDTPNWGGGAFQEPENYFIAGALPGSGGSRGGVFDTDPVGSGATSLSDATATEFRLRPGETGTGMVAVIWRNDRLDMWSYDEDSAPSPQAGNPEPAHTNGVQPVAARFFCSRVDTANPAVDIPAGAPGGATDTGVVAPGGDLQVANRQVGEIVRCPLHVPNLAGRQSGVDPTRLYMDPWCPGGAAAANGNVVGTGPGGETPLDIAGNVIPQAGNPASPNRTVGCGAVHMVDAANDCWCGRRHNPAVSNSLYCNYCGTRLAGVAPMLDDVERAAARIDVDAPQAVTSRPGAPDTRRADGVPALPAEAVRGTKDGVMAPGATYSPAGAGALRAVTNPLFASLPAFLPPTYDPGAGGMFENGVSLPYQGAYVAYRLADEDHVWFEDALTGSHGRSPALTSALSKTPVMDRNGRWDAFYRCPDCGNKHPALALANGTGAAPYLYTDRWTAAWATELECSYGRNVGAVAANTGADECPGHQICPACGVAWEVQGEGQGPELTLITLTICPFDGVPLVGADSLQARLTPDALTAEEFDPLVVQANVTRQTRLAADRPTANLGRVTRQWNLGVGPAEMTPVARVTPTSGSNYTLGGAALLTQGLTCANMAAADARSVTTGAVETPVLVRMDADPSANRSPHRTARALPVTRARLFAGVASAFPAAGNWGGSFAPGTPGGAGAQAAGALMRGGTVLAAPLPIGEGNGNYEGSALAFVDTDGNGALNFLDRSAGLVPTNSLATPFDGTEDYPLEPVVPLNLRLRVTESRMPSNDSLSSDLSPAPLFTDTDGDGLHDRLNVVWESNRIGGAPDSPMNLYEAATTVAGGPGIARDYIWNDDGSGNPWVTPVTSDLIPGTVNGSPEVYLNPANSTRWLLWHRLAPTNIGAASTLWSASAPADMSTSFATSGTANYIFDSSLDKSWIRGFINVNAAAPANHWSFWNSGKRGKEEIHYCYGTLQPGQTPQTSGYDPQDPNTVADEILPVSNGIAASAKRDWVGYGGTYIRKPPKSPFTYAKDPAPVMEIDPITGEWMLRVFFSGFVPQEGNSDICYVRFRMSDMANPDANYGKAPAFAVTGATGGEELRADGPRQTFGSQHLDWMTTRRRPDTPADPDFMRAVSPALDPQFFIHLVLLDPTSPSGTVHEVYRVTWAQEAAPTDRLPHRYDRSEGVYRLGGLTFTRLVGSTFAGSYSPVEPRTGRPLELIVDPAAGLVRFSAPLYNPSQPGDPATYFNSGSFAGLDDVQLWANYTPLVRRLCRSDANDDSPSAFFDYGEPNLNSPVATQQERVSLGRTVVFWRRSHGASEPPHFGRTSFMYATYCNAIQVAHPPITNLTSVTDLTLGAAVAPIGADPAAGIIGLPWGTVGPGDRIRVEYDSASGGSGRVEYHIAPGWGEEQRVNVDTVYSEGPLLARREWYAVPVTDASGAVATQYMARYWLFWTSPRGNYYYDQATNAGTLTQSPDIYYATVVPEYGTSVSERPLPSR